MTTAFSAPIAKAWRKPCIEPAGPIETMVTEPPAFCASCNPISTP